MGAERDPLFIVPAVDPDDAVEPPAPPSTTTTPDAVVETPRTTTVVRHIDPWSVFRVTLVFHFVLYLTLLLTGVLLWNVANATGTVDNVERFMESFGWETFEFKGGELFHQAWIIGLFLVIGLTGLAVLVATVFNLITDLVGGVRVTVVERTAPELPSLRPGWLRQLRVGRRDR